MKEGTEDEKAKRDKGRVSNGPAGFLGAPGMARKRHLISCGG